MSNIKQQTIILSLVAVFLFCFVSPAQAGFHWKDISSCTPISCGSTEGTKTQKCKLESGGSSCSALQWAFGATRTVNCTVPEQSVIACEEPVFHSVCRENSCVQVEGEGESNCKIDTDCFSEEVTPTPTETPRSADPWDCSKDNSCEKKPEPPVCTDGTVLQLPANFHVVRDGEQATVKWFGTGGNMADVYFKEVGQANWTHAIGDVPNKEYNEVVVHSLNPALGYEFGVRQHNGCGGGQTATSVVVDGPEPVTFPFSFWIWTQ